METASNENSERAEYRFKPLISTRPSVKPAKINSRVSKVTNVSGLDDKNLTADNLII